MGELIFIAAIGIICAAVGFIANAIIQYRARKQQIVKRISQIPFWDIDK